ncbi:MAG TPA: U32 family peptidase [Bryobacteraceae bacterium]|nr:U32 family peptidase [Bryobacteraceae bacterium]
MPQRAPRKPEIMSPAGYWPQLHTAIEAGADAVYFGLKHFSARAKVGFSLDELPDVMRTLHSRGVRGFITFNTLVFEHELEEAGRTIAAIARAGADALIVQDYGIVRLAREIAPELELHASTQMSITSADGVNLAQSFGIRRVNLARELSLDEVRAIAAQTNCELEIFVHGALCVAYSGQCFSSEAWGGRSANRGQCAQACRLPYEMVVDGAVRPLGDARYLLSPGDLFALEQIPEIVKIGVAALKIEGRYKDENYVALTTSAYRRAVDEACAGRALAPDAATRLRLEQVYSRGLGPFFMSGTNHQALVRGRAPRHRGVLMGRVELVDGGRVLVEPTAANSLAPLKAGDGIVFDAAGWRSPEEPEEGGRIYQALPARGGQIELRFANRAVQFQRIRRGDLVWRTHDPEMQRAAEQYTQPVAPVSRQLVWVHAAGHVGGPLVTEWSLADRPGVSVTVTSEIALSAAQKHALSAGMLQEQFGRLGNTPYEICEVSLETSEPVFIPAAALNKMRREAVERLQTLQAERKTIEVRDADTALRSLRAEAMHANTHARPAPALHLLVRTPEQLAAALESRPASITLDYLDLYGLRPSLERVKSSGIAARVASPRVLKPGEARIVDFLVSLDCAILVRSAGFLHAVREREHPPLIGDFSLNAANSIAAAKLLSLGLNRITPTHDLNAAQIADLATDIGPAKIEVIAYQHLPVFHTEHCVFCRFLSNGTSYRDCGRPCEKHQVQLKDSAGRAHPVMADVGCRNTVFGAEAQEASAFFEAWLGAGIRDFRLEFAHETSEQVRDVVRAWERALAGEVSGPKLRAEIRSIASQGTTQGSLFVPEDYLKLPVLQ